MMKLREGTPAYLLEVFKNQYDSIQDVVVLLFSSLNMFIQISLSLPKQEEICHL